MSDLVLGIIIGASGFLVLSYIVYLNNKIKKIETAIKALNPEELARAILKIKIPITDLPPDLAASLAQAQTSMMPQQVSKVTNKPSYLG